MVPLDTQLSLIAAWNPSNSALSYHDQNYLQFKQSLMSDGTCTNTAPVNSCETSLTDKGVFTVNYDSTNSVMIMNCTIPD